MNSGADQTTAKSAAPRTPEMSELETMRDAPTSATPARAKAGQFEGADAEYQTSQNIRYVVFCSIYLIKKEYKIKRGVGGWLGSGKDASLV